MFFLKLKLFFSNSNLFNVNNIQLEKKDKITNKSLADVAIKKGFNELTQKILLSEDKDKLANLDFSVIKQLVTYYQITKVKDKKDNEKFVNFSITFDKNKIHELFSKKEFYILKFQIKIYIFYLLLIKETMIYLFLIIIIFMKIGIKFIKMTLIEFILPLENIETIQKINEFKR